MKKLATEISQEITENKEFVGVMTIALFFVTLIVIHSVNLGFQNV